MLYTDNELHLNGAEICGLTFYANEDDACYAIWKHGDMSCGVTIERGISNPYLRFTPCVQYPREVCKTRDEFDDFTFECDDDAMVEFKIDPRDGEITLNRDIRSTSARDVERVLGPTLAWLEKSGIPALRAHMDEVVRANDAA